MQQKSAVYHARGPAPTLRAWALGVAWAAAAAGCAQFAPSVPPSEGHLSKPAAAKPEPDRAIPPPARISAFVPPPKPAVKPQTYSVVVNEVPVKELLLALARDTKQNIDIHPGLSGLVSLNAINETLPAILERVSKQVSMRYRVEGNTIVVSPDTPYMKTYRVNYVNVTRNISSTVNVTGEVGASGAGSGGASSGGGGAGATGSRTVVTSTTSNDFWEQLRDNVRAILQSTRRIAASAEERAARAEEEKLAREEALKRAEAVSRAGPGAAELLKSAFPQQQRAQSPSLSQSDTGTDVVINPISGTITVLATEQQHQLIQQHLDSILNAVQRQVLIEATIVEVQLSEAYQGGIDWSRLAVTGGITFTQRLLGGFGAGLTQLGANFFQLGYANPDSSVGNITATVRLLQEFGNTRVLSSPKLMALNNQAALLKVVDNIVYFEVQAQTNQTQGAQSQTVNTTAKTVSVGVVMGVTPQINEDGRVTLTVRPTISRVLNFKDDPNPTLVFGGQRILNRVPEIQVREMESVLQVLSGQTVILGGLMQDETRFSREQLPGADAISQPGGVGGVGDLFRFRNERAVKTELVIFLRPTVVTNPSLDSDELKFFQRFLPQTDASPAPTPAPAR
jgi:general secretion pathway protein D